MSHSDWISASSLLILLKAYWLLGLVWSMIIFSKAGADLAAQSPSPRAWRLQSSFSRLVDSVGIILAIVFAMIVCLSMFLLEVLFWPVNVWAVVTGRVRKP